jgi:RimJ/RimL family protein N-acetyltransferase
VAAGRARWLTGVVSACPTLHTERLLLRPFRSEDVEALHAVMTTPEVRASLHLPPDFSVGDTWRTLISFAGLWDLKGLGQWALEERTTGRFVGRAGLYWRPEDDWPGVEVGWMLDPARWGTGFATEAGARAVRYGFEVLGEHTLFSVILPENTRSAAVARRLGYRPGGMRRLSNFPELAHMVWRLDRSDWDPDLVPARAGGADPVSAG